MKKTITILGLVLVLALFFTGTASAAKVVSSVWTDMPAKIDGSGQEWDAGTLASWKKDGVTYGFKNDGEFVYVLFIFNDPQYVSSIAQTGMTIYLNTTNKKSKAYGVRFIRQRLNADQMIQLMEGQQGTLTEEQKVAVRQKKAYFVQKYEIVNKKGEVQEGEAQSVKKATFRSAKLGNTTVYEFAIPLERPLPTAPGVGTTPGSQFKIGFEWGGMTKAMRDQRLKQSTAMASRGRASRATSSTTSERRVSSNTPPMSSIRRRTPKKYTIWADVALAQK